VYFLIFALRWHSHRSWQGNSNETQHAIVGGTTILEGFEIHGNTIQYSSTGVDADASVHDVAIVVVGEFPYAETLGDNQNLVLDGYDTQAIANVKAAGINKMILVTVSGRPLILPDAVVADFDAIVAAWLPGTEGDGVAEVFFGDYDFTGKLPFSWPKNMDQVLDGFIGDNPDVLYEFGYGLDMASTSVTVCFVVLKIAQDVWYHANRADGCIFRILSISLSVGLVTNSISSCGPRERYH
jgi:beta-glucosidase